MKKRHKLFYRHRLASSIFYLFSFATLICTVSIVYTSITSSLNISGEGIVDGPVNEYYYKSGYFYEDEACTVKVTSNGSDVRKFSDMVNIANDGNTIYMMSQYNVGVGTEEVTVGAKNIQVKRHPSFTSRSMFDVVVSSSAPSSDERIISPFSCPCSAFPATAFPDGDGDAPAACQTYPSPRASPSAAAGR